MDKFLIRKPAVVENAAKELGSGSDSESSTTITAKRKFRPHWLNKFSWLRNVNGTGFCVACEKKLSNNVSYLKKHDALRAHIQNVAVKKDQVKIDSCMSQECADFAKQVRHAELTIVMFLICHNLPFLLMDFLPTLLLECCPDSKIAKSIKCGRTKSTQITEILGDKAKEKILGKLKITKFSLIVDETTDVSPKKALVLVVRYFDNLTQSIHDQFLSLIEVINADANSLYETIKSFFNEHKVPIKNIIGLATDGANVMAGEINSLQTKFKKDVDLFYIKCSCHSLHLCSAYACKKLPLEIESLCRNIYKFFLHSPKRINEFKEFQDYCSVPPHKILGISQTRWLSLEQVINRVVEQWTALHLYFISCFIEVNGIKAVDLAEAMGDHRFKAYLLFLSYVLNIINALNKEFQSEKIRLPYLYAHIEMNFKLILSNFMKNDYVKSLQSLKAVDLLDENNYLPVEDIFVGSKARDLLTKQRVK